MKTKTNITVYQCDFCSKKLFRKHAMANHEVKCKQNPLNIRACFDCSSCEKVKIKYETTVQTFTDDDLCDSSCFKCNSKDIFMYPPILEYNNNGVPTYSEFEGKEIVQEKMPVKCELKANNIKETFILTD